MTIQEQIVAARVAQAAIKDYTQEQIDKLVYEVAKIISRTPSLWPGRRSTRPVSAATRTRSPRTPIPPPPSGPT